MALNQRTALFISYGIISIAWLLLIISNVVPRWGLVEMDSDWSAVGLWQLCASVDGRQVCEAIQCDVVPSGCGKLTAARLFLTIACIWAAISILLLIICIVRAANTPPMLLRLTKWIPLGPLVTGLIGVATGIAFVEDFAVFDVGAAAALGIAALIINLIGAFRSITIPEAYQSV